MNRHYMNFYAAMDAIGQRYNMLLCENEVFPGFFCYKACFTEQLFDAMEELAREKASHVNKKDQNGNPRDADTILMRVFKGVISETLVHIYLLEICRFSPNQISRYDLERPNFDNSKGEYDIALMNREKFFSLGVKSSDIPQDRFQTFLRDQHCVIASYENDSRTPDNPSDYYFGLVFTNNGQGGSNKRLIQDCRSGRTQLFLTSGASYSEMYGRFSSDFTMPNNTATFHGLRSYIAGDAKDCARKIISCFNGTAYVDYLMSHDPQHCIDAYSMFNNPFQIYHLYGDCKYLEGKAETQFVRIPMARQAVLQNCTLCSACWLRYQTEIGNGRN